MSSSIRTVLIGTSATGASDLVVSNGLRVARACGAQVHLVHAFQAPLAYAGDEPWGAPLYVPEAIEARREARLRLLAAQASRLGIRGEEEAGRTVMEGPPYLVVADTAAEIGADLVVVGAAEGWERLKKHLGSTADRVVREACCPVLLTRGVLAVPPRHVLFGVDLSPISGEALRQGLEIVAAMGGASGAGATATALLVVEVESIVLDTAYEPAVLARIHPAAREELARFIVDHCPHQPWCVKPVLRIGASAAAEVLALAEEQESDLVVVGTHGRRGLPRLLLGSVADRVLRNAARSVLVVPGERTGT
ncbi:MAG TPA: universal stress protein [Thermoanaerobaculia bacterium]